MILSKSANIVVQSLSHVRLFATLWIAAYQASLSFTISQSLLKLMSIELVMPSNHLILCHPLLLPSIFLRIRVFSNESALCKHFLLPILGPSRKNKASLHFFGQICANFSSLSRS